VIFSVASVAPGARHPNAAKLFVDFLISDDGQNLFRDRGCIPVAPAIPPREPKLRPDGKTFRGIFFTPRGDRRVHAALDGNIQRDSSLIMPCAVVNSEEWLDRTAM
jgi:ABC-type Fe3+ transport system substrate-binding protein